MDRISDLPGNVIDSILTSLPIRDAARTSILSRKWKHRWCDIPQLVFDPIFASELRETGHPHLMFTIHEILLLHTGPIDTFTLDIPCPEGCPEIEGLILFLSRKGVQVLNICMLIVDMPKLPSYLFSCLELRCLNLCRGTFEPPRWFQGFSKLIRLEFHSVELSDDFFETFIPKSPLLEELELSSCSWPKLSCTEINAPNLKCFSYSGFGPHICFLNSPLLASVSIYNYGGCEECFAKFDQEKECERAKKLYLDEVINYLPALEYLKVNREFLQTLDVRETSRGPSNCLQHLKVLEVHYICFADVDDVFCGLGLIRSSPNLEELMVEMSKYGDLESNPLLEILESDDISDVSFNKLRRVKLLGFSGIDSEMEFVNLLLSKSPQLKKMIVVPQGSIDKDEHLQTLKNMIQFRGASTAVELYVEIET